MSKENIPAKILVVDDEPDLKLLITQRFRQKIKNNELDFTFASNGKDALQQIDSGEKEFDIVLTDINMPVMDGLTLLVNIKERKKIFKSVVISAYGDMDNIRTAMNRGAFDFIVKPIDFTDFETTLYRTLTEMVVIRDGIFARENLSRTIAEKEKAEQSEKFKQQFLANMSHEIRTPMNSILGLTNLLIKSELTEQQMKHLHVVKKSSENLLVIINDILDLSKIEAGKMEFEKVNFVLADLLDTIYHTLLFKTEEKKLEFKLEMEDGIPKVLIGDPVRLNQILLNLTGNAIKFTEKGSVTISVKLVSKNNDSATLGFFIQDTGIGISKDKIHSIFESFSQASSDTTRKYGGTGLGLTISKQLIELQEGYIRAESEEGKGTTFIFGLTYGIGKEEELEKKEEQSSELLLQKLSGISILLVEDNAFNQMVAVDTLSELIKNVTIEIADNGKIALEKIQQQKFHIVLMDLQMPEMGGIEATEHIRALAAPFNSIPVMAMTANVTKDEMEKCAQAGMNDYITKPFQTEELLAKMAALIK